MRRHLKCAAPLALRRGSLVAEIKAAQRAIICWTTHKMFLYFIAFLGLVPFFIGAGLIFGSICSIVLSFIKQITRPRYVWWKLLALDAAIVSLDVTVWCAMVVYGRLMMRLLRQF